MTKISIVIPSYNQDKYIERSLQSIFNQEYDNIELIIIDGGSSDRSVDIIKKYEDRISYWISEKDSGQSDALNKGYKVATGDIYGWLNSDDLYAENILSEVEQIFNDNPKCQVVFGDWLEIDSEDGILNYNYAFDFSLMHTKYEGAQINVQAMFWRSEVHKRFSGFDVRLQNSMDYQMLVEFGINEGPLAFLRLPKVLGSFRRYQGQKTDGSLPDEYDYELRLIAEIYGCDNKYTSTGHTIKFIFAIRRLYWYLKRGGLHYTLKMIYGRFR